MKQQTIKKIISKFIILVFVVFIFGFSLSIQAEANSEMSSLYSNPNQGGNNAYKFKISDVVNSNVLSNVVGCTGVVNKVSTWMMTIVQSPVQAAEIELAEFIKYKNMAKQACLMIKGGAQLASGATPFVNDLVTGLTTVLEGADIVTAGVKMTAIKPVLGTPVDTKTLSGGTVYDGASKTEKVCMDNVNTMNDDAVRAEIKKEKATTARDFKEQCFDGIALTLARNQLTAMTRSAMNWVNSGYGGSPFFVQNTASFMQNIERGIITNELSRYGDANYYPYARGFSTSFLQVYQNRNNFADTMKYTLNNYLSSGGLGDDLGNVATRSYENNFANGGWNGWLAFTQQPQNNPLGFTALESQRIADQISREVQDKKDELIQGGGFLSQKKCIKWQVYNADGTPKTKPLAGAINKWQFDFVYSPNKTSNFDKCEPDGWKTITPGSIIKDKVTGYLGSPERQLELARTINDSLNALFSVLISKLERGGLSGLSDSVENRSNWNDNLNNFISSDGNSTYDNNGAYGNFNLTRDLGNTFVHGTVAELGTWNAKINFTKTKLPENNNKQLYAGVPPEYSVVKLELDPATNKLVPVTPEEFESFNTMNGYFVVDTAGKTKLINEGYNGWEVGDRAFWDGNEWQNWKKGQTSPIKKRGVIQIQQDYIVAANEIIGVLPNVLTNLGELDYCLPGPNPSYQTNSSDAQSAYQGWVGSMYVGPRDANRTEWRIDREDSLTYKNLENIFSDNKNTWDAISDSNIMWLLHNFGDKNGTIALEVEGRGKTLVGRALKWFAKDVISVTKDKCILGVNGCQNYHWAKIGTEFSDNEIKNINNRKELMETASNYVNSYLFQDFYAKFDKEMNEKYFTKMTNKYLDTEISIMKDLNPAYVPMAESGFDLTKNIKYYNDDIAKVTKEYVSAIAQAKINIAKLNPIKSEVSGIIKAAQDRRDANLITILNDEAKRTGGVVLTEAQYKIKYTGCLDEENIQVFDPEDITKRGSMAEENCIDGIDNDLNGLVDSKDPVCPGYVSGTNRGENVGSRSGRR